MTQDPAQYPVQPGVLDGVLMSDASNTCMCFRTCYSALQELIGGSLVCSTITSKFQVPFWHCPAKTCLSHDTCAELGRAVTLQDSETDWLRLPHLLAISPHAVTTVECCRDAAHCRQSYGICQCRSHTKRDGADTHPAEIGQCGPCSKVVPLFRRQNARQVFQTIQ